MFMWVYNLKCFDELVKNVCYNAALLLHPDKNKHPKAGIAFKLVYEVKFPTVFYMYKHFYQHDSIGWIDSAGMIDLIDSDTGRLDNFFRSL